MSPDTTGEMLEITRSRQRLLDLRVRQDAEKRRHGRALGVLFALGAALTAAIALGTIVAR